MIRVMEKQMHLAAQYLAAAEISFLEKKADDSHTNFGFSTDNGCLYTHPFSENNDKLCLDYKRFSLEWRSNQGTTSFRLDGATHSEVIKWLSETSKAFLNKEFHYKINYKLPYTIDDTFTFKLVNAGKLVELMHLRILAQFSLEQILNDNKLKGSVRVWPHHFDTAVFTNLKHSSGISLGLGLAIPDSICNEYYLYISGYKNNRLISTSNFENLKKGEWKNDDFKGAIMPATKIVEPEAIKFFKEAIYNYKKTK